MREPVVSESWSERTCSYKIESHHCIQCKILSPMLTSNCFCKPCTFLLRAKLYSRCSQGGFDLGDHLMLPSLNCITSSEIENLHSFLVLVVELLPFSFTYFK